MKNSKIRTIMLALAFGIATTTFTQAASDKTSEKARDAVENAKPNDWNTLAKSAGKCLRKKVNLTEANKWLKQSIIIDANAYNLTLKGDYHALVGEPKEACAYYLEAMKEAKKDGDMESIKALQKKIMKIRSDIYQ